jgi:serine/alanine racemase
MRSSRNVGGLDYFRLAAALLIVGIHTYPLLSVSEDLNFLVINVLARVAAPFFLMVTGYFVLPRILSEGREATARLKAFTKKIGLLYLGATLFYLPISIYAGHYSSGNVVVTFMRNLVFDGAFYHLWYLPALIVGVLLLYALSRRFSLNAILGVSLGLYTLGLFGDSYYGLTVGIPFLRSVYQQGFHLFSYTRNGLFYAPVFLALGATIAQVKHRIKVKTCVIGLTFSLVLMAAEGMTLHYLGYQRHDSMYLMLIPCMFFLFQLLLGYKEKAPSSLREISLWVYLAHPAFIIGIRGLAKAIGLTELLIDNSMIHFLTVGLLSLGFACLVTVLHRKWGAGKTHASDKNTTSGRGS